jgi:hypothetical protein
LLGCGAMKRTLLLLCLGATDCATPLAPACLLAAGCDLPELSAPHGPHDMGEPPSDLNVNTPPDLSGTMAADLSSGTMADLSQGASDMADNPNIPPGAKLGICAPWTWTASASVSDPSNPPAYAIDGLQPTRWSSGAAQSVGQYYQIDFGGFIMLNQVAITHTYLNDGVTDFPHGLDVLVSPDGVDFSRKLQSGAFTADPGVVTLGFNAHAARYLRLQLNQATSPAWFTIHELAVGCQSAADGGVPVDGGLPLDGGTGVMNPNHANWTATASMTDGANPVANAFDGNPTTRWADGKTPQYGDEWFLLDLGQILSVSQVVLTQMNSDWPSAYELSLSSDNIAYTVVADGLGAEPTQIAFKTQSARYLKIRQIGSGYAHWWGINEITVIQ